MEPRQRQFFWASFSSLLCPGIQLLVSRLQLQEFDRQFISIIQGVPGIGAARDVEQSGLRIDSLDSLDSLASQISPTLLFARSVSHLGEQSLQVLYCHVGHLLLVG